ncbi:MAG TPA: hypothetical protein VH084_28510 [Mycobacterium sp.]|jgi:hypothetical protein|nr:hypothetical protein [Mycobacterium sp.]
MSAGIYQFTVNDTTPWVQSATFNGLLQSGNGFVSVTNNGPEVVYAGMVQKTAPTVVAWPGASTMRIYPGQTAILPADTTQDFQRLSFNSAHSGNGASITITLSQ